MSVISARISNFAAISALLSNWYLQLMILVWYRVEIAVFIVVALICIGVALNVVFIRWSEVVGKKLRRRTREVSITTADLIIFVVGSIIFISVTIYALMTDPHSPLSTTADILQIVTFLLALFPLWRKLLSR